MRATWFLVPCIVRVLLVLFERFRARPEVWTVVSHRVRPTTHAYHTRVYRVTTYLPGSLESFPLFQNDFFPSADDMF